MLLRPRRLLPHRLVRLLPTLVVHFLHLLYIPAAWYDFVRPTTHARSRPPSPTSPLTRYDYDHSDAEWSRLAAAGRRRPWRARRERAFFRGSVYWYRRHGRTRAFAQSMATPHELDADWLA